MDPTTTSETKGATHVTATHPDALRQLNLHAMAAALDEQEQLPPVQDLPFAERLGLQCSRLIANAIIYYNSAILSRLLTKFEANGNALALITQISLAAWRHILLNGHYTFQSNGKMIDLDALVAGLEFGVTEISGVPAYNPYLRLPCLFEDFRIRHGDCSFGAYLGVLAACRT